MNIPIPPEAEQALELAAKLGVLQEVVEIINATIAGDINKVRSIAEAAAIKAAARAPYVAKGDG